MMLFIVVLKGFIIFFDWFFNFFFCAWFSWEHLNFKHWNIDNIYYFKVMVVLKSIFQILDILSGNSLYINFSWLWVIWNGSRICCAGNALLSHVILILWNNLKTLMFLTINLTFVIRAKLRTLSWCYNFMVASANFLYWELFIIKPCSKCKISDCDKLSEIWEFVFRAKPVTLCACCCLIHRSAMDFDLSRTVTC